MIFVILIANFEHDLPKNLQKVKTKFLLVFQQIWNEIVNFVILWVFIKLFLYNLKIIKAKSPKRQLGIHYWLLLCCDYAIIYFLVFLVFLWTLFLDRTDQWK